MKQRIISEQLNELSDKGKKRLRKWWKPQVGDKYLTRYGEDKFYGELDSNTEAEKAIPDKIYFEDEWKDKAEDLPLLSIGQMIDFLYINNNKALGVIFWNHSDHQGGYEDYDENFAEATDIKNLCNTLWKAVKEVLEK